VTADKRDECGCHRDCTTEPHECEKPCRWPDCLTEAEHAELVQGIQDAGACELTPSGDGCQCEADYSGVGTRGNWGAHGCTRAAHHGTARSRLTPKVAGGSLIQHKTPGNAPSSESSAERGPGGKTAGQRLATGTVGTRISHKIHNSRGSAETRGRASLASAEQGRGQGKGNHGQR
jgi:hypothetical protein